MYLRKVHSITLNLNQHLSNLSLRQKQNINTLIIGTFLMLKQSCAFPFKNAGCTVYTVYNLTSVCIVLFEKKQFSLFIHIYKNKTYKPAPDIFLLVNLWGLYSHSSVLHYKYMFANDMSAFQRVTKQLKQYAWKKNTGYQLQTADSSHGLCHW